MATPFRRSWKIETYPDKIAAFQRIQSIRRFQLTCTYLITSMVFGVVLFACANPTVTVQNPPAATEVEQTQAATLAITPAPKLNIASFSEFGRNIRFNYAPTLAQTINAMSVPVVLPGPEVMFSDALPAHVLFSFLEYDGGREFYLPYPFQTPRLMVFPTQDFDQFGPDQPTGFPQQLENLRQLLDSQPDLAQVCTQVSPSEQHFMPFLPWLNSAQAFCAQPEYIEFSGGKGIRYLIAYSQGPAPTLDHSLFYTFQGLSDDGETYISAVLPILSGVFPVDVHTGVNDQLPEPYTAEQLATLNALPGEYFSPPLGDLDALIRSLIIEQQ